MALFDANLIATYQKLAKDSMIHECDLIALMPVRTATGSTDQSPVVVATVPCYVSIANALLVMTAEQDAPVSDYIVHLPADVDLAMIVRLQVRGETNGSAWTLDLFDLAPLEPRSYMASQHVRAKRMPIDVTYPDVGTVTVSEA